jgi:hypothetical protein
VRSIFAFFSSLTLPSDSLPGQSRMVLSGASLPPPLDTFTWLAGTRRYSAAIIFYGTGDDSTYTYLASVQNTNVGTPGVLIHIGQVASGAVVVDGSGNPLATEWFYQTGPGREFFTLSADDVSITAPKAFGNITLTAQQFLKLISSSAMTFTAPSITANVSSMTVTGSGSFGSTLTATGNTTLSGTLAVAGAVSWGTPGNLTGSADGVENTSLPVTATSYGALSPTCGTFFNAPPSGIMIVDYSAVLRGSAAANFCAAAPQLRNGLIVGSGSIFSAASDNDAAIVTGTVDIRSAGTVRYAGLTPGAGYNVELLTRVNTGTGNANRRKVIADPTI